MSTSQHTTPAVELRGITKAYPGVVANDDIDLVVHAGEIHGLLGENGAGKSTLMSILSGMVQPDAGTILVQGSEVRISSPRAAFGLGIGTVYQHLTLVPTLTVLENLLLGSPERRLDVAGARARFDELAGMLGARIDPDAVASTLSLGELQQVEIVKALWRDTQVLILDEPTSMLTPQGVAELQAVMQRLKARGIAIVFITHKLHEAIDIGDRVSILKAGRRVGGIDPDELRSTPPEQIRNQIVDTMFGEGAAQLAGVAEMEVRVEQIDAEAPDRAVSREVSLELRELSVDGGETEMSVHEVSFAAHRGEILGIAGVDGNGQRQLAQAIAGQRPISHGDILLDGRSIRRLGVPARQRLGLRYISDDRLHEGTVRDMSVAMNTVLKRIGQTPFWRRGAIREREIDTFAEGLVEQYEVRTPSVHTNIGKLSGGNIQKVVLARELAFDPRLVVYNKPTYGLDVKTASFVRTQIREQAEQGVTAVVISTELDELVALCDRIVVLSSGRLTGVVENGADAHARVGELMLA
ncbi:putative B6 ABC transporter ATP-binding protein [Conexibacter woesei]|uniref:ABC transporter related protein n=1 Tax=Conexibacter woesei (strain DSM 14684 / CCUG 47730 / CIP 108061 / JCM 11494 / NBRC 100937 / ID131577) TaxID=469383 RepID=D3F4V0_CONWI|nr:ABC transporter ATP-binding protein [Conexibacter woesei]ADB52557.1 ABC transporter related protein [Conexibacter woesei DSM 14684]